MYSIYLYVCIKLDLHKSITHHTSVTCYSQFLYLPYSIFTVDHWSLRFLESYTWYDYQSIIYTNRLKKSTLPSLPQHASPTLPNWAIPSTLFTGPYVYYSILHVGVIVRETSLGHYLYNRSNQLKEYRVIYLSLIFYIILMLLP